MKTIAIYTTLLILVISMTSFMGVFGNDVPTMSPIIRQTMSPTVSVTHSNSNLRASGYRPSRISSEDEDEANNKYTSGTKVGIIIASISVSILVFICILCICLKFF